MKHAMQRQRGLGLISLLFYLATAVFVVTVAMKLGPDYMEYLTIRSVMKDLTEDPSLANGSKAQIRAALSRRLYINAIETVDKKAFTFTKVDDGYLVSVDYQSQEHLLANVDVVMSFKHEVLVAKK